MATSGAFLPRSGGACEGTAARAVSLPTVRLLALLLLVASACVPARRKVDGNIVRDIAFDGNGGAFSGQNDYQLRTQLEQRETGFGLGVWPFVYTVDPKTLRQDLLARDAYRLEVWYAHHGWFDARFQGWQIRRVREATARRAGVVDLRGVIDPGPQSTVRTLRVEGLGTTLQALGKAVLRGAPIREGDPFDLAYVEATRVLLLDKLRDHAHAYAQVALDVEARPDEQAVDVVLSVVPGVVARIGEITIEGHDAVDERFLRNALDLAPGQPYSLGALRDAQRRLFELGTFAIVTVEPDLSDPTRAEVPIRVRVTETRFRTLRVGVGFDYDSFLPVVRASSRLKHVNLFQELVRAELGVRAGLAFSLAEADVASRLPTWGVDLSLSYPRLFSQRGAIELQGEVEQDVYSGLWAYRRPEADLHFVYRFSDDVQLRVGPHVEQYTFLGEFGPRVQQAQQRLFGVEGQEGFEYQLTALDQYVTWDWRDDPVRTTRGSYYSVWLREAFALSPSGYSFFRATAEARRFVPVRFRDRGSAFPVTLAGRTRGTVILPFGQTEVVPLPERAFLGGATSLRGFRPNQVGPYTTLCTYDTVTTRSGFLGLGGAEGTEERVTRYHLPNGGTAAGEVGSELRYDWIYGVTLAGFGDVGLLSDGVGAISPDDLRFSVGVGARYDTLIGPVRVDLSVRPLYPEDLGPTRFAQCALPDEQPRVNDFFSNFPGLRDERHPPFALVFFLTFGEAI